MKYLDYQVEGINFLASRSAALLADEQGLGKTIQAIGALNKINPTSVLIVCPASLKLNWKHELATWLEPEISARSKIHVVYSGKERIPLDSIIIINYDLLTRGNIKNQLIDRRFEVLICDEAHYLKNAESKRTKAVLAKGGLVHAANRTWLLTGTPITNRPIELWPMLRTLSPETIEPYVDYYKFARRFCAAWQSPWGFDTSGASNIEELNSRLTSGFMLRRLKKNVLKELPDKIYQFIPLRKTKNQVSIMRSSELNLNDLNNVDLDNLDVSELAGLRKELALSKVDSSVEYIKDLMKGGLDKLVIFSHHREVIENLSMKLSDYNPVSVHGGTSMRDRDVNVFNFQQNDSVKIFIGQIQAAGTGLTLTKANTVLFIEFSWTPSDILQAVDRCHRIGQKDNVLAQFLVLEDSLEVHIMRRVLEKMKIIQELLQ